MKIKWCVLVALLIIAFISFSIWLRSCTQPDPVIQSMPVVSVTPVTNPEELKKLPTLPNNDKPIAAVKIPAQSAGLGMKNETYVVSGASGNTYVANVESVDWGFRFDPKASIGISRVGMMVGADVSFFSYWRINADALVYLPIDAEYELTDTLLGIGVSAQISENTSAGVARLWDFTDRNTWAVFISIKF